MNNNDILRSLRFTFDLDDTKMMELCSSDKHQATRAEISDWLKRDDDPAYVEMEDYQLAVFLNNFITEKRGKKEGGQPEPEKELNNNIVFRKLRIALDLKDDDILAILKLAARYISKHELSAFFRKPGHAKYRPCLDQILRNFLQGLRKVYRDHA